MVRKPVVWGKPLTFSIEPTNFCNLECPECPSGLGALTRPLGLLKFENFKNIIDQIYEHCFYIQLFFQGEPYINKELPEMIKYARSKNIYVSISTNGLLINEKKVDIVLKNAPDKLIFSIDGLDERSYQNYRIGGTFKDADAALRLFIKKKREKNLKKPFVEFQFIVMKQNEDQIEKVFSYGKEVGVDNVVLKTMQLSSYENAQHFLPENQEYRRYTVINGKLKMKGNIKNHCFALWRTSVVTWDGKIIPCCFDKDAKYELGLLNGNTFNEIWKSEKYYKFRNSILQNRNGIDMCTNCSEGLKINIVE
ncbi:MAG: radical SAM protein [Ignavibacteria bacterium CG_4_9_14_3_um_filter_36_18]|nr:radical SAM protein [Ignavibacteria bacterium]PJB01600.1 MAG: radical SAM protein [Ignavibacteria bacterium CG_4_9_14_3_um_filter_36_18]